MPETEISSEYDNENENLKADIKRLSTQLAATKEKLARAEDFIQLAADQHCPQNPETALGRTLKMLINDAKEYLEEKKNEALRNEIKAYRGGGE